jgi:hypothetical protein
VRASRVGNRRASVTVNTNRRVPAVAFVGRQLLIDSVGSADNLHLERFDVAGGALRTRHAALIDRRRRGDLGSVFAMIVLVTFRPTPPF